MNLAQRAVGAIACTIPTAARARYREEWLADLDGVDELNMSEASIVWGAAATAVTIDRDAPEVSGITLHAAAARRARWAVAAFISAGILGTGLVFWGGYGVQSATTSLGTALLGAAGLTVKLAAIIFVVLGLLATVRALLTQRAGSRRSDSAAMSTSGLRPSSLVLWLMIAAVLTIGALMVIPFLVFAMAVLATPVVLVIAAGSNPPVRDRVLARMATRLAIGLGTVAVTLATVAVGTLHIVVWNPIAAMPGLDLDAIYGQMAAAGESPSAILIWLWAAFWTFTAVAFGVACLVPQIGARMSARTLATAGLTVVGLTLAFHWVAGFNMGMSLADTFAISGGDAAISGPALSILGQLCLVTIVWLALLPRRTNAGRLPEQTTRVVTH
ncbi:hypothetical protein [Salinibacterium sp. TMP30]|uniref:hypothetical protein n=1 Tax=Salinibacterium sp. TMP30 TaxID=3138237 RepID=UPI00313A0BE3